MKSAPHGLSVRTWTGVFGIAAAALLASCGGDNDIDLPTCAQVGSEQRFGLAGNPAIVSVTSRQVPAQEGASIGTPATPDAAIDPAGSPVNTKRFPPTATFCQIDMTVSNATDAGYAPGQAQSIKMRIVMPERANWKDRIMMQGGSGSQGSVDQTGSFGEGANYEAYLYYAIRQGMIGATTDAGHTTAENGTFAIIQASNSLNVGKITDWSSRASTYTLRWAKVLAKTYYGRDTKYTYWNGGSGGGYQGMGQLQKNADEYDGFLIGSPAQYWTQLQMATPWPGLVIRDTLTVKGKSLSTAQLTAAKTAAVNSCDAADGVTDGLVADPRTCKFNATSNICGSASAPAAPNCLDVDQAAAVNMIWDGPRNKKGEKIWFGWDRTEPVGALQTTWGSSFFAAIYRWAKKDLTFDPNLVYLNQATRAAAGNPAGSIAYEDIATLGSNVLSDLTDNADPALVRARAKGVKVLHTVGNYDKAIFWRQSLRYYRAVASQGSAAPNFTSTQSWYRLFVMPGQGDGAFHTIAPDATGPGALDPFLALVDWVENSKAPDRLLAGSGSVPNRTRPLCPYPQWAQYKGSGSTEVADSFTCAGNLETADAAAQDTLATYKRENGD